MAIRIRRVHGRLIALCAAKSVGEDDDVYLDDECHQALSEKFREDFQSEGYDIHPYYPEESALREQEESNNPSADDWRRWMEELLHG